MNRNIEVMMDLSDDLVDAALMKFKETSGETNPIIRDMFAAVIPMWVPMIHSVAKAVGMTNRATKVRRPRRIDQHMWEAGLEDPSGELSLSKIETLRIALELFCRHGNNHDSFIQAIDTAGAQGKRRKMNIKVDPHGRIKSMRKNGRTRTLCGDAMDIRKATAEIEACVKVGSQVFVRWTHKYSRYSAKATVVTVNRASVVVSLLEQVTTDSKFEVGQRLSIPKSTCVGWSPNFRIDHLIADPTKMPIDREVVASHV